MNKLTPLAASLILTATAASADGISIEPGLWETTSTITMPMLQQPQQNTTTQCIGDGELSMDDFNTEGMDPACAFNMEQLTDDTMMWSFDCPVEGGGTSHGEWEATSFGDRVEGKGMMTMNFQGQEMQMTMSWEGRHVGACP